MEYRIQILKESKNFFYFLFFLVVFNTAVFAQKNSRIELNFMRSIHGTGDLSGYNFSSNYINPISTKLSYVFSVGGFTHSGSKSLLFAFDDRFIDSSILYTTSGIQLGFGLDYKFINSKKHKFHFRMIPNLRYQSTSIPDVSTILYPPLTELPFPVIVFENNSPSETIAAGIESDLLYNFKLNNTISINLLGSLQFDTNGDTIRGFGLGIVKSF
ncbi:MAG: hypothetical protein RI558_02250 [Psychroflexus sp.]|nr:hypothetical protein [Psychroflexus sp.]